VSANRRESAKRGPSGRRRPPRTADQRPWRRTYPDRLARSPQSWTHRAAPPTAVGRIVPYRLEKLTAHGVLGGAWLDCGCAEGDYALALAEQGATSVVGVDIDQQAIDRAQARPHPPSVSFRRAPAEALPFSDRAFDGVLLNEVLEHVADEAKVLDEIHRVLRPGGHLALFSPNRWFPFEGHGLRLGRRRLNLPVPLVPWLPYRLTAPLMRARNYWPGELRRIVSAAGFLIVASEPALPQFEVYRWVPRAVAVRYWRAVPWLERLRILRQFGVSSWPGKSEVTVIRGPRRRDWLLGHRRRPSRKDDSTWALRLHWTVRELSAPATLRRP
jgi:SAM-dependent methyltransferase